MSFKKKIVTTYAKSLIQHIKDTPISAQTEEYFNIDNIISTNNSKLSPDIYLVGEELLLVRSLILSSKMIRTFFKNPTYSEKQKFEILLTIFPGLSLTFRAFLKVLTERSHLSLLPDISEEYTSMLIKFRNLTHIKIFVASPLKDNYGLLLLNSLRTLTNSKEIVLSAYYSPRLLGGLIIEYNSKSVDASILKEFSLFFNDI
jgi:ATP synthase F1 delta subunit